MSKEYIYEIDKYTIGVDENGEDGIGMTVAKIENGEINVLGNCYGKIARCIDLLIKENQKLKKQLEVGEEQYNDLVEEKEILQEQLLIKTLQLESLKSSKRDYTQENILTMQLELKNRQQKGFVRYLEEEIEFFRTFNLESANVCKDILVYYKKIIGDDDDVKNQR